MSSAKIDELKIVIKAEDKATPTIEKLINELEALAKVNVDVDASRYEKTIKELEAVTTNLLKNVLKLNGGKIDLDVSGTTKKVQGLAEELSEVRKEREALEKARGTDAFSGKKHSKLLQREGSIEKSIAKINTEQARNELKALEEAEASTARETEQFLFELENSFGRAMDVAFAGERKFLDTLQAELERNIGEMLELADATEQVGESAGFSKVGDAMSEVADGAEEAGSALMAMDKDGNWVKLGDGMRAVEHTLDDTTTKATRTHAVLDRLGKIAESIGAKGMKLFEAQTKKVEASLAKLARQAGKVGKNFLGFPFKQVTSGAKKFSTAIGRLFTKLKTVATYRALRGFIKMINTGFQEGTQNAYQWSKALSDSLENGRYAQNLDSLSTSALYLKNAFGAVAIPIINAFTNTLNRMADMVVEALNAINKFIATITGAGSWTKALRYPKEFAEGLDDATGSAKKLKDAITILGIDELNPLNAVNEPSGGSGGADDALNYSEMFEEVAVDAGEALGGIFDPLEKAWQTKGKGVLDALDNALASIKTLADVVGDSFYEVWTNGTGQESIEHLLGIFTGISNIIGNIATQLSVGWTFNSNGTKIIQNLWDMLNSVLDTWDKIANKTAEWANSLNFAPIISAVERLTAKFKPLVDTITNGLGWAWENILLPLGKWLIEDALPPVIDVVGSLASILSSFLDFLGKVFVPVWNNILKPIIDFILTIVSDLMGGINDFFDFLADPWGTIKKRNANVVSGGSGADRDYGINTSTPTVSGVTASELMFNKGNPIPVTVEATEMIDKIPSSQHKVDGVTANLENKTEGFSHTTDEMWADLQNKLENFDMLTDPMTANLERKEEIFPHKTDSMYAYLDEKMERFGHKTEPMTADLVNKNESFTKTTDNMTANLANKYEGFDKTTSDMTAKLAGKTEKFDKTTGNMTAKLATKSELFGKTTDGMTAKFEKAHDSIPSASKTISGVTATVTSLVKGYGVSLTFKATMQGSGSNQQVVLNEKGGIFSNGFWKKIPQYASGTLNAGSMFIAGESGAEIVGNINGRTEVLNQSQIAQAMASSMMQANASQNAILQEQNNLLRQLLAKDSTVTAVLSTSSLIDGANRQNRRTGRTVIPVGV